MFFYLDWNFIINLENLCDNDCPIYLIPRAEKFPSPTISL